MKHSKKFEFIRGAYQDRHNWSKRMVKDAVTKGCITAEEYEEIVGEPLE